MRRFLLLPVIVLAAGCGSKAAAPPAVSTPTLRTTTSATTTTTTPATTVRKPKPPPKLVTVYSTAGIGAKTTKAIAAPPKWQLQWGWTCHGKKGSFAVTAKGGSAGAGKRLLSQVGIGGGGQRAFPVSGTFSLTVQAKAGCPWTLKIVK
ncbi:MAG TPA: hypothetical protein VFB25_09720 [Gaiellaceae bacterium]|nr:hypothetical protein [Gaiellaceae bacterium]